MNISEPPYLPIGTEVSAKYKGAFCEAKVKKVDKSVKCKVFVKEIQSNLLVTDEFLTGPLKIGATVEVKHPDTGRIMEAVIKHMSDSSMYTVVFDDADERTLRRTQLCLKGDKHFMESETLDNLPLSHPEHFGTPVISKNKRSRLSHSTSNQEESEESSEEEASPRRQIYKGKVQDLVGKVMVLESSDRKKSQLVPVLVVLPDAHSTGLKTKDHVLIRSFKDGKFFSVGKKEIVPLTREIVLKNEDKSLKPAMEKALLFVDNRELPPTWNKAELLGSEDEEPVDEDDSDDDEEPSEDKDRFIAQLIKFCDDRGTPMNKGPSIGNKDLNLYKLFRVVQKLGGYNRVTNQMKWRLVYSKMLLPPSNTASTQIKNAYKKYLHAFEDFYRKLGSSMGTISRPGRFKNDSGRSILNFRGREAGKTPDKNDSEKEKVSEDTRSEAESDLEAVAKPGTPKRPKSARARLDLKDPKEEKKEDMKEKVETKKEKEDKKETKTGEKVVAKKADEKKDSKIESEKKPTKKKEEVPAKPKKETEEEKDLKDLQKKIGRRRSARNDDKTEEEEEEEQIPKKDKDKTEEREEEKKKENTDKAVEKKVKKKKAAAKPEESDEDEGKTTVSSPFAISNLPVHSKLKVRYGRGKNTREYEAKILEVGSDTGPRQYFVHYLGWNNRHDEWVKPERIVKVLERPDSRKKNKKTSPGPATKSLKKKSLIDKPPASPSSVKSDSSINQNSGRSSGKGSKTPQASSPASVSSASSTPGAKPRPTRSNSIDVKADGLPAKRRTPKTSSTTVTTNGSDTEGSEKSVSDSEEEKKKEKVKTDSSKSITMPTIVVKKGQEEEIDIERNVERSPPHLSKVTDIGKEKLDTEEKAIDSLEKEESKEEPVAPVLKVMDFEKSNSEPILQKFEAQLSSRLPKTAIAEESKEKEVLEKEGKKKEPEKRIRKPPQRLEDQMMAPKVEKAKFEKVPDAEKNKDTKKEDLLYEFNDNSDDDNVKVCENKKALVLQQEIKVEKDLPKKEPPVSISVDKFFVKNASQEVLNRDTWKETPVVDEKESAKSDSEVEKRLSRKKKTVQEETREVKKLKVSVIEKKTVENANTIQTNILSVSPERKPFVTLAAKKQGFSPIIRKVPSVNVQRTIDPPECAVINVPKADIIANKVEKKDDAKKGPEMVVIHKESLVKHDILVGRKVDNNDKEIEQVDKKVKVEELEDEEKEESRNEGQNVKKKVRKKTKKKIEMEELESSIFPRKTTKTRGFSAKLREVCKENKDEISEEKLEIDTNTVKDIMEIDLHCEEQICSGSASPETVSKTEKLETVSDSQGFDILTEVMEGLEKEGMLTSKCATSRVETAHSLKPNNVFENTPPTTPEHDSDEAIQQGDQCEQIKGGDDTHSDSEVKTDTNKQAGSESPEGNVSPSNRSTGSSSGAVGGSEGSADVPVHTVVKRRRVSDETTPSKRRKRVSRGKSSSTRAKQLVESDSEASNLSAKGRSPHYTSDSYPSRSSSASNSKSNKPSKYNFNLEEGKYLEGTARITFLVEKIREIRKIYMNLKSEVACIDRRRKRLKKREKEGTANSSAAEGDFS